MTHGSSRLLAESQIVKNATVCMVVVIAVAVVVALVAVVEVVGDIGVVVASAVAAVVLGGELVDFATRFNAVRCV